MTLVFRCLCQRKEKKSPYDGDSNFTLADVRQMREEIKREIKAEIAPLRDSVIMLNTLLPVCDLTQDEDIIQISDDETEPIQKTGLQNEIQAVSVLAPLNTFIILLIQASP